MRTFSTLVSRLLCGYRVFMAMAEKQRRHYFPIRVKTGLIIAVFGLILAEIAMVYFSLVASSRNEEFYKNYATRLSDTVALSIDLAKTEKVAHDVIQIYRDNPIKPRRDQEGTLEFEAYLKSFDAVKQTPEYRDLQAYLVSIKKANPETDGIYLGHVEPERKEVVYILYDEENADFPVGIIDPLYEEDYPIIEDWKIGFVASIYQDEVTGAYLATAGTPIVNAKGELVCYCLVDIRMDQVRAAQANSIIRLFVYLIATVIVLIVLGLVVIHFILIKPIATLQAAAKSYDVEKPDETHQTFAKLELKVNDEFADLAESMKAMEADVHEKIHELTQANASLLASQKVAGRMAELANKDGLTGVRNKTAFENQVYGLNERIAKKEELEFGLAMVDLNYLKTINDEYGHDSGDKAIIKLCNLVCAIFAHSAVYRVGGDEFVILLKGRDYAQSGELIAEFEQRIQGLIEDGDLTPEEQVSAAIGYAEYHPETDACVDDVFKRADQAMYKKKRAMKGLGD